MRWRTLGPLLALVVACAPVAAPSTSSTTAASSTPDEAPTTTTSTTSSTSTTTTATQPTTTTTTLPPLTGLAYESISDALHQPVLMVPIPGSEDLAILERSGRIQRLHPDGTLGDEPYADLTDRVKAGGIEQGLLGMAFHPEFPNNGRAFLYYVGRDDNSRLVEMRGDAETLDPGSELLLLTFDQAIIRHYAGMVAFGPDGYLYVSVGEGGAASTHSQNPATLLSSILRLDVDGGEPYGIPPDNPFVGGGGAPEVWAFGLRNPWRFDIDGDLLYIADVGHERWEELNVVDITNGGYNFGWLRMEGSHCFQSGCDPEAERLVLPVYEYSHDEGCSITGGFVYRGDAIPELEGEYLFSDWCSGWLRSYRHDGAAVTDWTEQAGVIGQVNAFGYDHAGEVYVLTWDGQIARIVPQRDG